MYRCITDELFDKRDSAENHNIYNLKDAVYAFMREKEELMKEIAIEFHKLRNEYEDRLKKRFGN